MSAAASPDSGGEVISCRRCQQPYSLPSRAAGLAACPSCGASPRPLGGSWRSNRNAATLSFVALLLLVPGVLLPFIRTTQLGTTTSISLVGSIGHMLRHDDVFLGVVLLVFSLLFPFAKLILVLTATSSLAPISPRLRQRLHHIAAVTGKYSLLDVLVVAILIVAIKMKGIAQIAASSGTIAFCLAIVVSILAGLCVNFDHLDGEERQGT